MFSWSRRKNQHSTFSIRLTSDNVKLKTWKPGDSIGEEWKVIKVFSGGFGHVYLATNSEFKRFGSWPDTCALKTFRKDRYQGKLTFDDFEREARAWIRLGRYGHIVNAFFFKRYEDMPFVVSEAIINKHHPSTLRGWMNRGPLPIKLALFLGVQICMGMEYASKNGIAVHCDIKPENIFVTDDGVVKIGDWGLSKITSHESFNFSEEKGGFRFPSASHQPINDEIVGTPLYMSPELITKRQLPTVSSDIYAFGTVVYEMLTGQLPFDITTFSQLINAHTNGHPTPINIRRKDIPEEVGSLIEKCLSKQSEKRPKSFAELKIELTNLLESVFSIKFPDNLLKVPESVHDGSETTIGFALHKLGFDGEARFYINKGMMGDDKKATILVYDDDEYGFNIDVPSNLISKLEQEEKNNTTDQESTLFLGGLLEWVGRFDDAKAVLERALEIYPEKSEEINEEIAHICKKEVESLILKGHALNKRGNPVEALKFFKAALEKDGNNSIAWYDLGTVQLQIELIKEAIFSLEKATILDPSLKQAWNTLGATYFKKEQFDQALRCFDRALALDPFSPKPWLNRGNSLLVLGNTKEALKSFYKALEIDPDYEQAKFMLAQILRQLH